ncbi:diaminobutyrate acetyltransferase [Marinobacterium sediminicola]|uniref:L-2,4-diaminobutyric acid acetyltransferase n=1 Tax=Marinobacterium sediminicola TaxID=518898 RepID=A0ABY1RVV9_9GAMM|nr:diaminobutyrate acetyltransferase [Marinobacterium sediminicola]ULG70557.1 diaminobutyrate acetyltransferase [Marinobacterium sediminicola]SMR69026.1 L-2,4-diaminobutyric acid acetyltransferase [Marinobacterium sediminicola]
MDSDIFKLRKPEATDGFALHKLVERCSPLDPNSVYCNLLQCSHFAETAIAAENAEGELVGFISGYCPPERPDTLFVWQVAVDARCRGQKLGQRMLLALTERLVPAGVQYIETTITPGNVASETLFARVFAALSAPVERSMLFSRDEHFEGQHDDEMLYRAGPFKLTAPNS